jgi:hypothetical protein
MHVFELEGHPSATRAYAWSSPIEGSTKRRVYAVLHVPPVSSPADAVRAAIVVSIGKSGARGKAYPLPALVRIRAFLDLDIEAGDLAEALGGQLAPPARLGLLLPSGPKRLRARGSSRYLSNSSRRNSSNSSPYCK